MEIREYEHSDADETARLFFETVHAVNIRDYSREELYAWAAGDIDLKKWDASFLSHRAYVATEDGMIVGFGDMDETGYLDRLFVHKDFQGRGIATAICDRLEGGTAAERIVVHASVTARPFFAKRSYECIRRQEVERRGVFLTCYVMEKHL